MINNLYIKMKFQSTCSICLSKITLFDLRFRATRRGRKLICNHVFHNECIKRLLKPQCPLCESPIFNEDEELLLTCKNEKDAIQYLNKIEDIKNIFTFVMNTKEYNWLVTLMYKYCDFTNILADNLDDKMLVKNIISKGKVNWFKTFHGGLTFFDLVYEKTNDNEIIDMIYKRLPIPRNTPHVNSVSENMKTFTTPHVNSVSENMKTFTTPHVNSVSENMKTFTTPHVNSVSENMKTFTTPHVNSVSEIFDPNILRGWQLTHPPSNMSYYVPCALVPSLPERTAGIRRSFRLYPTINIEEKIDYPSENFYQKLYPVFPSAPPSD